MKRRLQSNPIHINELPEDLVVNILKRLPIQDAVRTSVLSSKWRYAWKILPQLVFDDKFCKKSIMRKKFKLMNAIYQVLLLHRGPLHEFTLSLSTLDSSCSEIDQFVLVVLQYGVKKFTLCILKGEPYRLPTSTFAYVQQLVYLELSYCVFKPPPGFKGFCKLESLVLVEVDIDGSRFSSLISSCPLLKSLSFKSSTNCGGLDIDTPNLEFLRFEGHCKFLCFKNTPRLKIVEISTGGDIMKDGLKERKEFNQFMLCGNLPVVEELTVDNFYAKYLAANVAPRSHINDLCLVKTLHLSSIWAFAALCLVRNSWNVEKLTIVVSEKNSAPPENWFFTPDQIIKKDNRFSDVTLGYLRKVELQNVSGSIGERFFIKHILEKSPLLKKFAIESNSGLIGDKGRRFFKQLMGFRRASPLVEIVFHG